MGREEFYGKGIHAGILSAEEQDKIRKLMIKNVKPGSKVLILGATAELRNIALELKHNVFSLDINLDMINKREQLIETKDYNRDVVARGNWLMPWFFKENMFDAILADVSFANIRYDEMIHLMKIVKRLGKDESALIFRQIVFDRSITPNEVVEKYKRREIDRRDLLMGLFANKFLKRKYFNYLVDVTETFSAMIELFKTHNLGKEVIDYCEGHKFNGQHNLIEEGHFNKLLMQHFGNFKEYVCSKRLYSRGAPIYIVKIRK